MFNLFIVLIGTFALALFLIYFISAHDRKYQNHQLARKNAETGTPGKEFEFREFSKKCMDLCNGLKLDVESVVQSEDNEVVIQASSRTPVTRVNFLIVGFHLNQNEILENHRITEISEQIISERFSKGIIITTGKIDTTILTMPELAPLELIDGDEFKKLLKEYSLV